MKEALKLALEALERYQVKRQDFERFADVITAIQEALAQPEQEPVAWMSEGGNFFFEPWLGSTPLYTTPPQRTWVGLTDDDKTELARYFKAGDIDDFDMMEEIEEKLKEKNT